MLRIKCPWCGERSEREFFYGGDATVSRPPAPDAASSQDWLEYIYLRDNPKGPHLEYWLHRTGCRRWFKALRNTYTNKIIMTGDVDLQPGGGEK